MTARRRRRAVPIAGHAACAARSATMSSTTNLDLEVRKGEILGMVGGSGTGKSVLLNTILGLKRPDGGQGRNLRPRRARSSRRMPGSSAAPGVMFQGGALFSALTVGQNVEAPIHEHTELPERFRQRARPAEDPPRRARRPRRPIRCRHRAFRRHAQARRDRPRAGARSRGAVPRRADRRPRPDGAAEFDS